MIKNYIDVNGFKDEYKVKVIDSFIRRTFSIDNVKLLFIGANKHHEGNFSPWAAEVNYSIKVLYSGTEPNDKDEYRELLKDTFFYHKIESGEDIISVSLSKDYTIRNKANDFISSHFVIEHMLYSFNKKLDNRGIKINSLKKVYISLSL